LDGGLRRHDGVRMVRTYPTWALVGYRIGVAPLVIVGPVPAIQSGINAKLDYPDTSGNDIYGKTFPSS